MMDLLVNLAASNKLNPAAYSLVVLTDDKWTKIDFKANKTIGLLAGEDKTVSVQIIPRKTEEKYKARSLEKPFEVRNMSLVSRKLGQASLQFNTVLAVRSVVA